MKSTQIGSEMNIGMGTHEGMSGKHNEDSLGSFAYQIDKNNKVVLGVVADGVGGQIAGEVASRLAVETVDRYFQGLDKIIDINRHLEEAINAANRAVFLASQENSQYRGMSTTMAITAILDSKLYTAHVGDSRIYLFRDGELRQISIDHTWAQEAIEAGLLTREQAKTHPNRNVIRRHLGGSPEVEVDHRLVVKEGETAQEMITNQGAAVRSGDTFLICSDGLTDMITDESVHESLYNHYLDLDTATTELINKANEAGGRDNITIVILQVPPVEALPPLVPLAQPITRTAAGTAAAAAAAAKGSQASASGAAPSAAVAAVEPAASESGGRSIALFLAGGAFVFIIVIVIAGIAFLVLSGGGEDPTPTAETVPVVVPDAQETATAGAPATAAIITAESTIEEDATTETEATPEDTPELIPTLRATNTPTRTRIPPTATPQATATATEAPSGGNGGSSPPRPTDPPPPD